MRRLAWVLALFLVAGAVPAGAAQTLTFTMPSIQMFESPYLVAWTKGYFADEGLDFKYTLANGGVATPALLSGNVDASASSASALAAIMRGGAMRIVLVLQNRGLYSLWSTRPDIRALADLKGKQIGIETRGDAGEVATRIALQQAGIPPDSVGYTPLGTANGASAMSGLTPAFVLASTDVTQLRITGELKKAHLVMDYKNIHLPIDGLAVSEKTITDRPELLHKMLRAIVKGMAYVRAYKQQTIAMMLKLLPSSTTAIESADYDAFLAGLSPDLVVNNEDIRGDLDVRAVLLNMPRDSVPPIDAIYNFAPLRAAEAEVRASHWNPTP